MPKKIGDYDTNNSRNKNKKNINDDEQSPAKEEKAYNTNKSINNQNDLFNMMLNVSSPEKFAILKSPKISEDKDKNNKDNYIINKNEDIEYIPQEDKEGKDKNINDAVESPMSPYKNFLNGNKGLFLSKEYKKNISGKSDKNKKNQNFTIESKIGHNFPGIKKRNNFDDLTLQSMNDIYYPKDNNNKDNLEDKNKNYSIEPNNNIQYTGTQDDINLDKLNKMKDLVIENIPNINYIGNDNIKDVNKNNNLIIQTNYNSCYAGNDKENEDKDNINNKKDDNKKFDDENLFTERNEDVKYEGDDTMNNGKDNDLNKNKNTDLDIQYNSNIIYNGAIKDNNLIIESNPNVNYLVKNKDNKDKNLVIETNPNINYLRSDKDSKDNKKNFDDLMIKYNSEINFEGNKDNEKDDVNDNNKNNFDPSNLKIEPNEFLNYEGIKNGSDKLDNDNDKDKNNIDDNKSKNDDLYCIQKPINNRYYLSKENKNKNEYNDNSSKKGDKEDKINMKQPEGGLLITKLPLKNNIDEIRTIQNAIKNYLLNNKNKDKEKIYKKPLFNQFYYYEDIPYDKNLKNKKKKKPKKENNQGDKSNKNNINNNNDEPIEHDKEANKKKEENNDEDEDNNNNNEHKKKNKNGDDEIDNAEESGPIYIKKNIPKRSTSEIYRIKHNHLLKIIKVQKGKSIVEKLIQSGKVVPSKPRNQIDEEEEDNIQQQYKSKTPNKVPKKLKDDDDDDQDNNNQNNKKRKNKNNDGDNDEDAKKKFSKSQIVDDIEDGNENDDQNYGSLTDYDDDDILRNKRIKKCKNNMGNYFYMSKIRKGDIDDSKIRQIQNKFRAFTNKDSKNKNDQAKDEDKSNDGENKVIPNVIKNNCYYEKVVINNKNKNDINNNYDNKNKVYKIPHNWKETDDDNNNMKNDPKINYITKTRHINFKDNKEGDKNKINEITKNSLSFIPKENTNINNNKITQLEKKPNCLLLPNKNNKTSFCFMTKERKLKLIKGIMLPLNSQKYITKERKKITDSNNNNINSILLPLKEISFIEKVRKKENMNQIKTIQNIFKIKKNKDDVKNIKNKPCYNNEEKSACLPRIKNYYKTIDSSDYSNEDIEKDNYFLNGYISKIYKRIVYKHPLKDICHISKKSLINKKKNNEAPKKNYSFLSLMDFFIKKNVQEYVYPKLPLDKIYKNRNNKNNKNKKADSNKYNFDSNKNPIDENLV